VTEDEVLELVLGKLDGVRQHGGYWMARCPAHEDREASLSVGRGTEQPVVLHCHAGCDTVGVLVAIGLTSADISAARESQPEGEWMPGDRRAVAVYDYTGERGKLLFQVLRSADKHFVQRHPDPAAKSGWAWNMKGVTRVPYRLPQLRKAARGPVAGRVVYIVEGEKDVHAIEAAGAVATCNPMGAGKWRPEFGEQLAGIRHAIIVADKDEPGREHALQVREHIRKYVLAISVVEAAEGKDAADHLAAGHGLSDFIHVTIQPSDKSATSATSAASAGQAVADRKPVADTPATWDGGLAELLGRVHQFLGRFVAYPSGHARVAHTLWIAHAHAMDAWDSTPRIAFLSPEPGSGKTRALEVSELLVPRPVEAVNATPAYLFRKVSDPAGPPTILYDEIDTLFGPKAKDNEEVRGMLNAGHRRGAMAGRCVVRGKVVETEELPAYCAIALAGLGDLPDTLMTRAVVIRMKRRSPDEQIEPYRRRVHLADGHAIRDELAAWATSATEAGIGDKWPEMPDGIADRAADVWECLFMIADAAGGDWPDKARVAAVALVADSQADSSVSLGIRLLGDIRKVWDGTDGMHGEQLLKLLNNLDESPWGDLKGKELDARRLASLLRKYEVRPADVRADVDGVEKVRKGYKREHLYDAWQRYLLAKSVTSATCAGCGQPMTVIEAGQQYHPTCEPAESGQ
jgi:5S rRNA maturation endonuclease (ribonuclease M5)